MPQKAGAEVECLSIAVELEKEVLENGAEKVGFRVGGGIDQDPSQSPANYPDTGIYITHVEEGSPAHKSGLLQHDKILQVNGYDFTMVTHEKALKVIKKSHKLSLLVTRNNI